MKKTPAFMSTPLCVAFAAFASSSPSSQAQTCASTGADIAIGFFTAIANHESRDGIEALSLGTHICNIGNAPIDFYPNNTNRHPVLAQGFFRYRSVGPDGNARFEQLGQSWCYHPFVAANLGSCCTGCVPGDVNLLAPKCSDPVNSGFIGGQSSLGPKWQVNAATGVFPYPPANPTWSGPVARRLQVRIADLDPVLNGGGQYFAEVVAVSASDSAAANHHNNASHAPVNVTGSGSAWSFTLVNPTRRERVAIQAWRMIDPQVTESAILVPGDGWFIVAGRASQIDATTWHYEYAVQNLSSDRSGGAFHVPCPAGVSVTEIGFHDVDYTNGDGPGNVNVSGTDWPGSVSGNAVSWATETFTQNQAANAIRWGTLYNFRFDASTPPTTGTLTLGLFKPGTPETVEISGFPVPSAPPVCLADWNDDGFADSQDFFEFAAAWFDQQPAADFNQDGEINSQDFFEFLSAFFAGC